MCWFRIGTSLGVKLIWATPMKRDSDVFEGVFSKISDEYASHFVYGNHPRVCGAFESL